MTDERLTQHAAGERPGGDPSRGLRRHAPAILVTSFIAGALLVTRGGAVAFLDRIGGAALVPLAEGLFGAPTQEGGDKLVHAALFFLHAATLVRSFAPRSTLRAGAAARSAVWTAGLLSFLYSGALEALQGVVGRDADPWDLLANGAGVGLCVAWHLLRRRSS
jgi:hypothetical protein